MSVVRVIDMWTCILIWIVLDILMIMFGSSLPEWLQFNGADGLKRDLWCVCFVLWVWVCFSRRCPPSRPAEGSST